jgi:hypothetical protein
MTLRRVVLGSAVAVALLLMIAVAVRHAIGETLEGPMFSTAVGVVGGLCVGSLLVVALGSRRSRL